MTGTDEKDKKDESKIAVARITAMQAVLVTLLTGVAGVAGAWIARSGAQGTDPTPNKIAPVTPEKQARVQHWLVIQGVDGIEARELRLTVRVNGIPFAYPADVAFTIVGSGMTEQEIPLPIATRYGISIEADVRTEEGGPLTRAISRERSDFASVALPDAQQRYTVKFIDAQGSKGAEGFSVRYRFKTTEVD